MSFISFTSKNKYKVEVRPKHCIDTVLKPLTDNINININGSLTCKDLFYTAIRYRTIILLQQNRYAAWIAVDRVGKKFIDCSFGSRGTETGQKLWEYLEGKEIEKVMTDHWKAYAEFLPENIHTRSKAETYTVEGYNSILRHFLARLRRKTKCYTKSLEMLNYSVLLLMKYRNKELAMLN